MQVNRRSFINSVGTSFALLVSGIPFSLKSCLIMAKPRKLKATWSIEADQNLRELYRIKSENVILDILK